MSFFTAGILMKKSHILLSTVISLLCFPYSPGDLQTNSFKNMTESARHTGAQFDRGYQFYVARTLVTVSCSNLSCNAPYKVSLATLDSLAVTIDHPFTQSSLIDMVFINVVTV